MRHLLRTEPGRIRAVAVPLVCAALVLAAVPAGAATGSGDSSIFSLNTEFLSSVQGDGKLPAVNALGGCFPNPFNPTTAISFSLAEPAAVELAVYDLTGRLVRRLLEGQIFAEGDHTALWNGRDGRDRVLAAGVYLVRLKAGDYQAVRRTTLLK